MIATPRVTPFVVTAALAALATAAILALVVVSPSRATPALAVLAVAYAAGFVVVQRIGFVLRWRGHSTKISLEEFAVLVGLLVFPAPLLAAAVLVGSAANQLLMRRPLVKATFNLAQYALAITAASWAYLGFVHAGAPALAAAVVGPLAFALVSHASLAVLFGALERANPLVVFVDRFLFWAITSAGLGMAIGLASVGLWTLHPVATLAVLPLFLVLAQYGRLSEWADGELRVRQELSALGQRVAGAHDFDAVASEILRTCGRVFDAGEATLQLVLEGYGRRAWRWEHPEGAGRHGVRVPVPAPGGREGELVLYPRRGQRAFREKDVHLLSIAASAASLAAHNAAAFMALRETNLRLERANRELEEFTLWTTHDMREPLRSVGTLAKILHDEFDALPRGEAKDLARRILAGSDGLKERIKALHEFSRVVQGDAAFDTVGLDDVLADAARGLEARIAERAAVVRRLRPLPVARVQRHRFEKVFANLLENALKHNDKPEPVIEVTWRDVGEEIEVSVRDNGPGVQPAYHERIFQLFQRGTSSREGGSGAGLAIVKRIVEQHGGRVWVERRPGPGADFRFTLPKPPAAVAPAAPTVRIVAAEAPLRQPAEAMSASG